MDGGALLVFIGVVGERSLKHSDCDELMILSAAKDEYEL